MARACNRKIEMFNKELKLKKTKKLDDWKASPAKPKPAKPTSSITIYLPVDGK